MGEKKSGKRRKSTTKAEQDLIHTTSTNETHNEEGDEETSTLTKDNKAEEEEGTAVEKQPDLKKEKKEKKEKKKKKEKKEKKKKSKKREKENDSDDDDDIIVSKEEKIPVVVEEEKDVANTNDADVDGSEDEEEEFEIIISDERNEEVVVIPPAAPAVDATEEEDSDADAPMNTTTNPSEEGDETEEAESEAPKRKRKRKRKKKNNATEEGPSTTTAGNANLQPSSADGSPEEERTVYVEGLPFDCVEDDVREFFISNECADLVQIRLAKWQDTGRLRGYGHVVFSTTKSKTRAIDTISGKYLQNRYIKIAEPKHSNDRASGGGGATGRSQPTGCRSIFCKNLPYAIAESDMHDAFSVFGKIVDGGIRLARNSQTKQLKGFGYVEFKNPEGALAAVNKASKGSLSVLGRNVFCDYEEGSMKNSFRDGEGKLWSKEHGSDNGGGGGFRNSKRGKYGGTRL